MTTDELITKHFGTGETITMDRGRFRLILEEYAASFVPDLPDEDPELEAMRDKFSNWLDDRIAKLKAPSNWIDITAEFVLEQLKERESWAEVIEE